LTTFTKVQLVGSNLNLFMKTKTNHRNLSKDSHAA